MDVKTIVLLAGLGLVLLAAAARAFSAPMKLLAKAAVNTLLGLGGLVLLNATTAITGLSQRQNRVNARVVGVLGLPGLALLLLVQWVVT